MPIDIGGTIWPTALANALDYKSIIKTGLVLHLDPKVAESYSTSDTSWYDLSGSGNHGTLINSPGYNSANDGSIVFDGVDDYVQVTQTSGFFDFNTNSLYSDVGYAYSVCAWFNFPITPIGTRAGNQSFAIVGKSGGIGGAETLTLFVGSATDTTYGSYAPYYLGVGIRGAKTIISPAPVNTGTWNNAVVTWDGTAGRVYFNATDRGAANIGTASIQIPYYFSVGVTGNGSTGPTITAHQFEGQISNITVYNRALTASEVLQNFNATRSRFGI